MYELRSYVRGHHVYHVVWTPFVGEILSLKREAQNRYDNRAVAVMKGEQLVGHVPRPISRQTFYFLSYAGNRVICTVTGRRTNRGVGLGVEVPCIYKFTGRKSHIKRLGELNEKA